MIVVRECYLDALTGVCESGKCRALHCVQTELQAGNADDDCVLGYVTPVFCCSRAPDPALKFIQERR